MKKLVKEHLNEKFKEKSDPIDDMGIGIPKYSVVSFDWSEEPAVIIERFKDALDAFGLYITYDPRSDGTDQYTVFITEKPLKGRQLKMVSKEANHED